MNWIDNTDTNLYRNLHKLCELKKKVNYLISINENEEIHYWKKTFQKQRAIMFHAQKTTDST